MMLYISTWNFGLILDKIDPPKHVFLHLKYGWNWISFEIPSWAFVKKYEKVRKLMGKIYALCQLY